MPATSTPPGRDPAPDPAPMATRRLPAKPPPCSTSWRPPSLRRWGPPLAVRVVWALARFSAVTSMRMRSAVSAEAEMSNASNMPMSLHPERRAQDVDARVRDLDSGLVLEAVGGELRRLGVDVDGRPVRADRADGAVGLRAERQRLEALLRLVRAERRLQRAVEVHVDSLVAGRLRVGEVVRQRGLALRGACHGLLEGKLCGVDQHGTESS